MKHLEQNNKLILIGASTGGPIDIKKIIKSLNDDFGSCMIIAQHMGDDFIASFTSHIGEHTHINVKVAQDNEVLQINTIYVTSKRCHIVKNRGTFKFNITTSKKDTYNPNIDELFHSCASLTDTISILACILTGIGADGSKGMLALTKAKATCIAANEASSAVYGMPLRAQEVSKDVKAMSLNEIINTINVFGA